MEIWIVSQVGELKSQRYETHQKYRHVAARDLSDSAWAAWVWLADGAGRVPGRSDRASGWHFNSSRQVDENVRLTNPYL